MNKEFEILLDKDKRLNNPRIRMFANLQLIRFFELLISEKYKEQIFRCPVHLSIGQEAIAVGVSMNLNLTDKIISTHRSHAHYIAKGGDLSLMLAEIMGSPKGCCKGRGGSMHILDYSVGFLASVPIVGSSLPIAVGVSLAEKQLKSNDITVAYVGDAALETGAFYESLNLIALKKLPILIIVEDNNYSIFTDKASRWPSNRNTQKLIEGFGIKYLSGGGDDAEIVYEQVANIISDVRSNQPVLIHLDTYRRYEHCGPKIDDNLGYRTEHEIASFARRDPIEILRKKLINENLMNQDTIIILENQIKDYVESIYLKTILQNKDYLEQFQVDFNA